MSKYDPLKQHLMDFPRSYWAASFSEIEHILGFKLPPSARTYSAWWSNDRSHSCSPAWLDAGWRSEKPDLSAARVTFKRVTHLRAPPDASPPKLSKPVVDKVEQSFGKADAAQPWDNADTIECRLGMLWTPIGRVLGSKDRLIFPEAEPAPAIYRFWIRTTGGDALYVGETENLARRFRNYRNPGPTQRTSLRINAKLREALADGAEIGVAVVMSEAWIERQGQKQVADLTSKALRCLFEDAALAHWGAREIQSLNRSAI